MTSNLPVIVSISSEPLMRLGIVSNCWRAQLERGADLDALIRQAWDRGYRAVELRQGSLGAYESAVGLVPNAGALEHLAASFPGISFNIALSLPFLGRNDSTADDTFAAGVRAACAVATSSRPHLRLVDLQTSGREVTIIPPDSMGQRVADLAHELAEVGGTLSIENASQPLGTLLSILDAGRQRLGADGGCLQLCFDPCNLARSDGQAKCFPERIQKHDLALVHLKQTRSGVPHPTLAEGDVDWRMFLRALKDMGYEGPALFEIAPHANIWRHLDESEAYFNSLDV
jgi:sugar phosphate isomerase/epimerase